MKNNIDTLKFLSSNINIMLKFTKWVNLRSFIKAEIFFNELRTIK